MRRMVFLKSINYSAYNIFRKSVLLLIHANSILNMLVLQKIVIESVLKFANIFSLKNKKIASQD